MYHHSGTGWVVRAFDFSCGLRETPSLKHSGQVGVGSGMTIHWPQRSTCWSVRHMHSSRTLCWSLRCLRKRISLAVIQVSGQLLDRPSINEKFVLWQEALDRSATKLLECGYDLTATTLLLGREVVIDVQGRRL